MYYVAVVQNVTVCSLYSYNTESAALAKYHSELANRDETRTSTTVIVFTGAGLVIKTGTFKQSANN